MEKESIFPSSLNPADFSQELGRRKRPRDRRQRSRISESLTIVCISFQTPSSPNAILQIPLLWSVLLIHRSKQHCELLRSLQSQHKTVELLLTFHHKIPRSTCSRPGGLLVGHQRRNRSKARELDQGKPNNKQTNQSRNEMNDLYTTDRPNERLREWQ